MTFNHLDPAVLMLIADELQQLEPKIAHYATISLPWLSVVEAITFRKLHISSEERLSQAIQCLTPDRRAAFRRLEVTVYLPVYEERKWAQLESVEEKNANNQTFTKSLRAILETINTWELSTSLHNSQPGHTGLTLEVQAICKSDYWEVDYSVQQNRSLYFEYDVHMLRQENSHLQLLGELPLVLAVSELIIHGGAPRNRRGRSPRLISGDAASCIAAACPRLRSIEAELSDRESRLPTFRGSERSAFTQSLEKLPSTITRLTLHYPGVVPCNHFFDPPAISSANGKDQLSIMLGLLSQQLETLELFGVFSDDLFDSSGSSQGWPKLRRLLVQFDFCTPNGVWMLEQDPEETEEEIDPNEDMDYSDMGTYDGRSDYEVPARFDFPDKPFRTAVNADIFDGISLAMSQALPSMPSLREAHLSVGMSDAGCVLTYTSDCQSTHKAVWRSRSTTMYEPHSEVLECWKQAVSQRLGQLEVQVVGIEDDEAHDLVRDVAWPSF